MIPVISDLDSLARFQPEVGGLALAGDGSERGDQRGDEAFEVAFPLELGVGNFNEGVVKRSNPLLLDGEIVARARELGTVPADISRHLDRALNAYGGIQRLAAEQVWERSGTRVGDYFQQSRSCMLGLLERSQHLVKVAATLERFQGEASIPEPYRAVAAEYRRHLERLDAATALMEEAEASLSRALLAISADTAGAAMNRLTTSRGCTVSIGSG